MAEVGVVSHSPATAHAPARAGATKTFQKHKALILAGGAGVLLLVMSRKKGTAATTATTATAAATDPNAQLQYDTSATAPSGTDPALAASVITPQASVDSGGGAVNTGPQGGTGGSLQPGAVDITISDGRAKPPPKPGGKTKPGRKPAAHKGQNSRGTKRATTHAGPHVPKSKTPPKGKPHPAQRTGGGGRVTKRKTATGTKKKSPALVESMAGIGAGQVVMGRHFPGALGHRMGPPERGADGTISRTVTLDYGGRVETHRVIGNGTNWRDHEPGMNPPSRGVPRLSTGRPV